MERHYLNCLMRKTMLNMNVVNLCWWITLLYNYYKTLTTEIVVCYIGTMFMQVEQGTKHPEAGSCHMFTVVIGYPRNYQIRLIKLIRGSKILNMSLSVNTAEQVHGKEWLKYPSTKTSQEWIDWVRGSESPPPHLPPPLRVCVGFVDQLYL